jgi:hypothetical protein
MRARPGSAHMSHIKNKHEQDGLQLDFGGPRSTCSYRVDYFCIRKDSHTAHWAIHERIERRNAGISAEASLTKLLERHSRISRGTRLDRSSARYNFKLRHHVFLFSALLNCNLVAAMKFVILAKDVLHKSINALSWLQIVR